MRAPDFFLSHSSSILSRPICSNSSAWRGLGVSRRRLGRPAEDRLGADQQLLLPAVDQRRVDVELPSQFVDGA